MANRKMLKDYGASPLDAKGKTMHTVRMSFISAVFVAALGSMLGLSSAPAVAHCAGKHTGEHPHCGGGGGGGDDGGGGKDQKAVEFNDIEFTGITSDGAGLYVNGEPGVDVETGKGIRIDLNSDGSQGDRHFNVHAVCFGDADACAGVSNISGEFPLSDSSEWVILNVFHIKGMPADGKFYPKNARLLLAGFADGPGLSFQFREPELFNPGEACSDAEGGTGAGGSVWVARSQDGGSWLVTTQTPADSDLGDNVDAGDAGEVACLELLGAGGSEFGRNYSIPFSFVVGPESTF